MVSRNIFSYVTIDVTNYINHDINYKILFVIAFVQCSLH